VSHLCTLLVDRVASAVLSLSKRWLPIPLAFYRSSKVLDVLPGSGDVRSHNCLDQRPCEVESRGCSGLSVPYLYWKEHAVEPRTGIEFPMILDSIPAGERNSNLNSKVSTKLFC